MTATRQNLAMLSDAAVAIPRAQRPASRWTLAAVVGLLLATALVIDVTDPERVAWARAFFVIFGSVIVQAFPFVVLGALAASAIEVFVPPGTLEKLAKLPRPLQVPAAALAGVAFPICECGSVPVARRLLRRGLAPGAAMSFMLAAPILNPIVLMSTYVAYRGRSSLWPMVLGRFGFGFLVAVVIGWALGGRSVDQLLRGRMSEAHDHGVVELARPESKIRQLFVHLGGDFVYMGRFLLIGATVAALIQTFLPTPVIDGLAGVPFADVAVMMALAFVLSLCSESDAFVAASFVQFGVGAQLAFLVFGPMMDLKLLALYSGTFRRDVVATILVVLTVATLVGALWLKVAVG